MTWDHVSPANLHTPTYELTPDMEHKPAHTDIWYAPFHRVHEHIQGRREFRHGSDVEMGATVSE